MRSPDEIECSHAYECFCGGRFGKGVYEDEESSACGGRPWTHCYCMTLEEQKECDPNWSKPAPRALTVQEQIAAAVAAERETKECLILDLKTVAHRRLKEAEKAWYNLFCETDVGPDRELAAQVYETLRTATRIKL